MSYSPERGGGSVHGSRPKENRSEDEIVFEDVPDKEPEDFTYREDPVEKMASDIISLEKQVAQAQRQGNKTGTEAPRVLLAKARYDQAEYNERNGRGKPGEAQRLLKEWQKAQDNYDSVREDQIDSARRAVLGRFEKPTRPDIGAYSAEQLRRHQ